MYFFDYSVIYTLIFFLSKNKRLNSIVIQEFKKYKPSLLYIGLVNLLFKHIHQKVGSSDSPAGDLQSWTERFANYIRHNDISLMESCRRVLKEFEEELMVCEDWLEMFDVLGFYQDTNDPIEFLQTYLQNFSK